MAATSNLSPALAASCAALFGFNRSQWTVRPRKESPVGAPAARLLASSAARRGQLTKAGRLLWNVLAANPRDREMRLALTSVMLLRDQPLEALVLLEELLVEQPDDAQVAERKGFILIQLGRLEEALEIYSELIAAYPRVAPLHLARGNLLLALGNEQTAIEDYRHTLDCDATYGEAWWALANIKTVPLGGEDRRRMESALARSDLSTTSRINVEFALGKAFEDAGDSERSFAHYNHGNFLQAEGAFDVAEATRIHVNQVIENFDAGHFNQRPGQAADDPIFVIGMPRSGTTLIEQILASHPDVEGTAELPTISVMARSLGEGIGRSEFDYSSLLKGYSSEALRSLRERYLRQSAAYRRTDRPFFIDKMPSNWMHVALIKSILPNARVIDIRRDPLDCCFSNFAQHFPRGHEYTNTLESLALQYRNYERLMDHFDAVAPGAIVRIQYEELVSEPERAIRELLERTGLPFSDRCLRFFENDRSVRTPSAQQVRQPINRRGIGRWRPYAPWLEPLVQALGPA